MNPNIILPVSGDMNRGDQALVWETVKTAKKAGYKGDFYILSEEKDNSRQSQNEGLKVIKPILKHPSRKFKQRDNNTYGLSLLIKWGGVSIIDLVYSLLFLSRIGRKILKKVCLEETKNTLDIFEKADSFFVKGGGFIHASGKISDPYTIYYALFHIFLAHSLNKPVYVMPNSFGPFNGFGVSWMVKKALNNCKVVTVRETISQEMLEGINVKSYLVPDLGFNLEKTTDVKQEVKIIDNIKEKHANRKLIAITARPYRFPKSSNPKEKYNEYIKNLSEFCKWIYEEGYMPVFVEQVLSDTTHESDLTAIKDISKQLQKGHYEIISNKEFDCRDIKYIYSNADYTIGTRFHSVIFSLSEQVPSIAIEYGGNKGKGILNDIGLSNYGVPIEEVTFQSLKYKFNDLVDKRENISNVINNYLLEVKDSNNKFINLISKER